MRSKAGFSRVVLAATAGLAATLLCLVAQAPPARADYDWTGGHDACGLRDTAESLFFAEGCTRNGFEEYLIIRNPNLDAASVSVNYHFPPPRQPMVESIVLEPYAGTCIHVNDAVGPQSDVSIALDASPSIIAERQVYFNYKGVWTGGHTICGVESPSDRWYFAEGTTHAGFREWLCIQNPYEENVGVTLTYMLDGGENQVEELALGPRSRKTVDVNSSVGAGRDVSVVVEASGPVVAERPMYFDYCGRYRGGHDAAGSTSLSREWFFAEGTTRSGYDEWLCIMNPGERMVAWVEYVYADRGPLVKGYWLDAHARNTINVNAEAGGEHDVSIRVEAEGEVMCERALYFHHQSAIAVEGGHVVVGSDSASDRWRFASPSAGSGFVSFLSVMNPEDDTNTVDLDLHGENGGNYNQEVEIPPRQRLTFDLNAASEGLASPWVEVSGTGDIVAERPAYFTYSPVVEPEPFNFARWAGIDMKSPIRYDDLLGCIFHEASYSGTWGMPNNAQVLQPAGFCLKDDNPGARHPSVVLENGSDPAYFIEETRERGTFSTTACDVQSKAGCNVYSPVDGTVLEAGGYLLYGSYPDSLVRISVDGFPGYHLAVLHMDLITVAAGQRVEAGKTLIGRVRDLVPYFHSGPNPYTREEGNHVHLQINYRPDMEAVCRGHGTENLNP